MKMFLDDFKVLDMNELIAVNGGYGSSSGGSRGSNSSSGYSSTSGGSSSSYSSSKSSTGSSHYAETTSYVSSHYGTVYSGDAESKVPEGYSATYGWLNEGETGGAVDGNAASNNDIDSDNAENTRYFLQGAFAGEFGEDFSDSACAATSLLNEVSEQYTAITGRQMTEAEATAAMRAAVENGSINSDNAYVNNWESAANDMWSTTGLDGSFSYGGENPTAVIIACNNDNDEQGEVDHFVNTSINDSCFDPATGRNITMDVINRATDLNGDERTLTFN